MPGWTQHLHVLTTHLKATDNSSSLDRSNSVLRRMAEASAVSNFFVTNILVNYPGHPYLLAGDLNEDVARPIYSWSDAIKRITSPPTGLRLLTPINPFTFSSNTFSIRASVSDRLDYVLPGGLLFSNLASSQIFRSDRLTPLPSNLTSNDSRIASDHLPVVVSFHNPYDTLFRFTSVTPSNQFLNVSWQTTTGRTYRVESSTNFTTWTSNSPHLLAATTNLSWSVSQNASRQFLRIYRLP